MRTLICAISCVFLISCSGPEQKEVKKYSIEQFYKNIEINGGVFSPDESRLLISSNESGIYNLYEINIGDGSKKQVTSSESESFFALDYVPGTDKILYSADRGGNELNHIYLLNEDGTSVDLTPGKEEKASLAGWSRDNKFLFYTSNKRDPRFFDLYKMSIEDWKPEMIYQNNEGMVISDISDDENLLALGKIKTMSEIQLFLLDRSGGQLTEISEPDRPGQYQGSGFSRDGQFFYYITDVDSEFTYLVEYEIGTGVRNTLFEAEWDVRSSDLSEHEKYRVITINEDGRNNLLIKDNISGENLELPGMMDGDIQSVRISESEKLMRLSVGTSRDPLNIYVYNFETKELNKLTETLNPEIAPGDLVNAEVVRFKSFDGLEIPAIYYKPLTASKQNKVPALISVHGGPGGQSRASYNALRQYLVNHGYALLAVNNRGSSGYGKSFYKMDDLNHGDKDLQDCIWGKKWLESLDYIDADRIGIIGGSYGGYMTMAAMTFHPDEFKVGVNIFGVTNWIRTLKSIPPYWESQRNALYKELGDPYSDDSVRLYEISPLFHAHQVKNPIMVLQGSNDPRVLQVESDEIVEAVEQNNVHVEYIIFPDEGHGFVKKENEIYGNGRILEFLDEYLKGDPEID